MVVLSAFIANKNGKPIVSRQFRDVEKNRCIELLNYFQSEFTTNKSQGNFIEAEDEHVRYLYKPIDDFYMVLITNLQSNIIQDIKTLNTFAETVNALSSWLLYKSLNDYVPLKSSDEDLLYLHAFDFINAFDEIIVNGYKENLKSNQVMNHHNMWCMEETWKNINDESKEKAAKENRKREMENMGRRNSGMGYQSFGNERGSNADPNVLQEAYDSYYSHASNSARESFLHSQEQQHQIAQSDHYEEPSDNIIGEIVVEEPENVSGLMFTIKEVVSAQISRDGDIENSELKGTLELKIANPEYTNVSMKLNLNNPKDKAYNFKTHPNIDKSAFLNSSVLKLRDSKKSFPSNDQALGVLRWRQVSSNVDEAEALVPFKIQAWISQVEDDKYEVTFEYELNEKYETFGESMFVLPINQHSTAEITDFGDFDENAIEILGYDHSQGLVIKADGFNASQGVFTITVDNVESEESLFPINVSFANLSDDVSNSLSNVSVAEVFTADEEPVEEYDMFVFVKNDSYAIV
mgnify:CR=1 FL=1